MTQPTTAATAVAQRLWEREEVDPRSSEAVVAVVERACTQLRMGIGRWIGSEGYHILLQQALVEARREHAALADIGGLGNADSGVAGAVRRHGADRVEQAFVELVALLIDQLAGIVGAEMAARLAEQFWTPDPSRRNDVNNDVNAEGLG